MTYIKTVLSTYHFYCIELCFHKKFVVADCTYELFPVIYANVNIKSTTRHYWIKFFVMILMDMWDSNQRINNERILKRKCARYVCDTTANYMGVQSTEYILSSQTDK